MKIFGVTLKCYLNLFKKKIEERLCLRKYLKDKF